MPSASLEASSSACAAVGTLVQRVHRFDVYGHAIAARVLVLDQRQTVVVLFVLTTRH
jgi:hypothetical protein